MRGAGWDHTSLSQWRSRFGGRLQLSRQRRLASNSVALANHVRSSSLVPPRGERQSQSPKHDQQRRYPDDIGTRQSSILQKSPGQRNQAHPDEAEGHALELNPELQLVEPAKESYGRPHGKYGRNHRQHRKREPQSGMLMPFQQPD